MSSLLPHLLPPFVAPTKTKAEGSGTTEIVIVSFPGVVQVALPKEMKLLSGLPLILLGSRLQAMPQIGAVIAPDGERFGHIAQL